jgi:hypothetical protein
MGERVGERGTGAILRRPEARATPASGPHRAVISQHAARAVAT